MARLLVRLLARVVSVALNLLLGPVPAPESPAPGVTHPPRPSQPPQQRRWMRLPLVLIPAALLGGGVFFISLGAPALFANQTRPVPKQPIPFDHQVHVQQLGLECAFCHGTASDQPTAGLPALQTCMGCHVAVGPTHSADIKTLQDTWVKQQPLDWARVWQMPDHVRFQHDVHLQAGVACTVCHGEVGSMHQVAQGQPMKMQDCVACHQRLNAPTTCDTCHY